MTNETLSPYKLSPLDFVSVGNMIPVMSATFLISSRRWSVWKQGLHSKVLKSYFVLAFKLTCRDRFGHFLTQCNEYRQLSFVFVCRCESCLSKQKRYHWSTSSFNSIANTVMLMPLWQKARFPFSLLYDVLDIFHLYDC